MLQSILARLLVATLLLLAGLAIAPNDTGGPGVTHAYADGWPHHGTPVAER